MQCLLLLPNGDFLSGSNDTTIKLWSNRKCIHTFPGHTDTVRQGPCGCTCTVPSYSTDELKYLVDAFVEEMVTATLLPNGVYTLHATAQGVAQPQQA